MVAFMRFEQELFINSNVPRSLSSGLSRPRNSNPLTRHASSGENAAARHPLPQGGEGSATASAVRIHVLRIASASSAAVTVAVPRFITTRPPAQFAIMAASRKLAPVPSANV